jgi:hypothetical protein
MTEYAFHELATVFPLLEGGEYTALIDDIRRHGLLEPITLFEGKILDGRNRYRACLAAGVEPRFREILFGDYAEAAAPPTSFAMSSAISGTKALSYGVAASQPTSPSCRSA